jgi:Lectin C-type domain
LFNVGSNMLEVRSGGTVLGTATVTARSNVTGVTWTSPSTTNSGTVKFGETVTFTVAGENLLADELMGFAVEKCGVSNTEVGPGTAAARVFRCLFNNEAGAVAGQMAGVVKDKRDGTGQVLFDGWKVPVEVPLAVSSGNVLLGAAVTDSCTSCPFNIYGNPALLTDGDTGNAARNLGTYSGSFNIFTSSPISLSRVVVFPQMSPSGLVSYEIQTSTSATGSAGTWTSYGVKSATWTSGVPFSIELGVNAAEVRVVKIVIKSSPSWVSFAEFEGYLGQPIPSGIVNPSNGHRYEVLTCGNWNQCRDAARAKGGELVTIRSQSENDWIVSNIMSLTSSTYVYIGLYRIPTGWAWSSSEAVGYSLWYPGRPDNFGGNQNFVHIFKSTGQWDDVANLSNAQAIVEYSKSGMFVVAANTIPGAVFNVPAGAVNCHFIASGVWSAGPNAPEGSLGVD